MQSYNKVKDKGTSDQRRGEPEREREPKPRYEIIGGQTAVSERTEDRTSTTTKTWDGNQNKTNENQTKFKRFKKRFLRKNSKANAIFYHEEGSSRSPAFQGRMVAGGSLPHETDDVFGEHIYEIPFSNLGVEDDIQEERDSMLDKDVNESHERKSVVSSNRFESHDVKENGAVGCIGINENLYSHKSVEPRERRAERWKQNKSMSLPVQRSKPIKPAPGSKPSNGVSQREILGETSSGDSSADDMLESLSAKQTINRSQSLPPPSKFSLNVQFLNGLSDLCRCSWYWGPLSSKEAEVKLHGKPDGTFLVRDSNDNRYLLSLSFRSQQRTLHTRIEFCKGKFSFYAAPFVSTGCHESIIDLIEECVSKSKERVFCYSKGRGNSGMAYPVRLIQPLSRFEHVCSLQHLCRFVIRQHYTLENIGEMPLPGVMKRYLGKNHFDTT